MRFCSSTTRSVFENALSLFTFTFLSLYIYKCLSLVALHSFFFKRCFNVSALLQEPNRQLQSLLEKNGQPRMSWIDLSGRNPKNPTPKAKWSDFDKTLPDPF